MPHKNLSTLFLDQSNDQIWMIDRDFLLAYANQAFLSLIKELSGEENRLNETIFTKGFGENDIQKWSDYYRRAFSGEYFEVEEHFFNPQKNKVQYSHITFKPVKGENGEIVAVASQSKDITNQVKQRMEAKQLMDASLDVFCTINEAGEFIYVSAAAEAHWGYKPEELIGKPYIALTLEEDVSKTKEIAAAIEKGHDIKTFHNRYRKKDGGIAYNLWSARWDEATQLNYSVARDNKEQIEQEEKIQHSEQRFKALVQEGSDLIGILDAEGNYAYVSPTSKSILGIAPEEFLGKSPLDFIHPEDIERTLASLEKITLESKVAVEPFRFKNKDNEWRWMETVLTNMIDNPTVKGIVANSRDITDKFYEEHKLKLFEKVINSATDAILITEADPLEKPGPKIVYVNEAFCRNTGYNADEVLGKNPRFLQGPKTDQEKLKILSEKIKEGEPSEITVVNYTKGGEEFWVNFAVSPVLDQSGQITHFISVQRDVTEQKNKELEKDLLTAISLNFNLEKDYISAVKGLCKTIGEFGEFEWVELWTPSLEKNQIQLIDHYLANPEDEAFYLSSSEVRAFNKSESLVGKVWFEETQLIWSDIEISKDFLRREAAKKIGLKYVMGIPLNLHEEVSAVLLVGTKKEITQLKNYAWMFKRLKGFIGSELNRKKLENDLNLLYNTIPDIVCLADFTGRFLKINDAGCKLLGYPEDEILYQSPEKFVHPSDKKISAEEIKKLGKGESTFKYENRYITKSGSILWLSWICNVSRQEGLIYATARNITEEKKLRLLNSQVTNMAKIGSWEIDFINQTVYWSNEVHELHGTDPNTYVPELHNSINFYRRDFREMVRSNLEKIIATGGTFDFEAIIINSQGKELWIRSIGATEFINGNCVRVYGGFQDIHEKKVAALELEKTLKTLEDYKFALDQSAIIAVTNDNGIITSVNDNFCAISKYKREEIIGQTHRLVNSKYHPPEFFKNLWKTIASKKIWRGEIKNKAKDGSFYWVDTTIVPFLDKQNKPFQYLAIRFDITSRKEAEESALTALSEKNTILESISDNFYALDDDFCFSYMNSSCASLLQVDPLEIIGKNIFEEHSNLMNTEFEQNLRHVKKTKETVSFEFYYEPFDRWFQENIYPTPSGLSVYFQDITYKRKAEQERNSLQVTLENSLNEIYIFDSETLKFKYVNKGALLNLGYTEAEIKKLTPIDIKPDHTKDTFKKLVGPLVSKEEEKIIFFTNHKRKDGSLYPVEVHLQLVTEASNNRFLAIILDITDQKKAEKLILQANERFEKVTEATNDAIWDWDIINETFYRSKAIENFFGKETSRTLTHKQFWKDTFHPEDLVKTQEGLKEAISNPSCNRWEAEYRILNDVGDVYYVLDRGVIVRNDQGEAIRMIGAMTNISHQKDYEIQLKELNRELQKHAIELERSNEELEQFAFVTSHDLQEPLRMITSFMDQLKRKYEDQLDEKALQYIYYATDGAKRMKNIILDLLKYSRAGKPSENIEEVNLNEVISSYRQLRRKLIAESSAVIIVKELPSIITYMAVVTQIFHGLLDNAIKYSREGVAPVIEIKAKEKTNEWEFSVADNGLGIDAQFFDKIFIIFQRLHNRTSYEGTGIGLSIVKRSVEFLDGKIWLSSTVGKGTTFFFTLSKNRFKNL